MCKVWQECGSFSGSPTYLYLFPQLPPPKGLEPLLPFSSAVRCYFHGRWYADGAVFSGAGDECTTCICQVGADLVGDGEGRAQAVTRRRKPPHSQRETEAAEEPEDLHAPRSSPSVLEAHLLAVLLQTTHCVPGIMLSAGDTAKPPTTSVPSSGGPKSRWAMDRWLGLLASL